MTTLGGPTDSDPSELESGLRDVFADARRLEFRPSFLDGLPDTLPSRHRVVRLTPPQASILLAIAACMVVAMVLVLRPLVVPVGLSPSPSAPAVTASPASSTSATGSPLAPGVIAWIDATPAPSPTPVESPIEGLPTCSTAALDLQFAGWGGLTGGTISGGVVMSEPDPGAARCVISGVPGIFILDARGKTMAIDVMPIPSPVTRAIVIEPGLPLPPEHAPLLVGQAGVQFVWSNWCGPDPGTSGILIVDLPGAGMRQLSIELQPPTCLASGDRSRITVQPLAPAEAPEPPLPAWTDLTAYVESPSIAVAGQPLHYLVTLKNTTDHAVPLDPCPVYVERLWSGKSFEADSRYILNCGPVGAIEPGASATFEMILEVPMDAPPGPAILLWDSDGPGPGGPKLPITIAPPGTAIGSVAPATLPPSRDQLDLAQARTVATAFETARASGDWQMAWQLLSPFSQVRIGSVDTFAREQTAFNDEGGSRFVVDDPSKSGNLLAPEYLGNDLFFDLKGNAQLERAWFVSVTHPDVRGASAGSEDLIVAPVVDGSWRVWVR